jgi:hypothetical protein
MRDAPLRIHVRQAAEMHVSGVRSWLGLSSPPGVVDLGDRRRETVQILDERIDDVARVGIPRRTEGPLRGPTLRIEVVVELGDAMIAARPTFSGDQNPEMSAS